MVKTSDAPASSPVRSRVPGGSGSSGSSGTTSTCRRLGTWSQILATFFRYSEVVVTSTVPDPALSRVAIGSGPNAENSGETGVPFLRLPSTAR